MRGHLEEPAEDPFYESLRDELIAADGSQRIPMLLDWYADGDLDVEQAQMQELLVLAWEHAEVTFEYHTELLPLLREYGPIYDCPDRLSGRITIYRGVADESAPLGISWTLDRDRARWFAERAALTGGTPLVYRASIAAEDALGYLNGRNEREVLVDPASLTGVEITSDEAQ